MRGVSFLKDVVKRRSNIPGFGLTLGFTIVYLSVIVLLPLAALMLKSLQIGFADLIGILKGPRTLSAIRVTLLTAAGATLFNAFYGFALAWVLARYDFAGKRLLDALVDIPFALPTAVAGIALTALFAKNGWFGGLLAEASVTVVYTPLGIAMAMAFTSLPFVVRTLQPVIADLPREDEEAARSLGAGERRIFRKVIFPMLFPALLTGCTIAFARCLGEFGAVIFIAGNQPMKTEIVALLTFIRLEEYDYPAAAAISTVMLFAAFALLLLTNAIQSWHFKRSGAGV